VQVSEIHLGETKQRLTMIAERQGSQWFCALNATSVCG